MTKNKHRCIRCDEPTAEDYPDLGGYRTLTFNHEAGALVICDSCFEEVEDRDLWK